MTGSLLSSTLSSERSTVSRVVLNLKNRIIAASLAAIFLSACTNDSPVSKVDHQGVDAVSSASNSDSFSLYVDKDGGISRPVDFLTNPDWTHLGAWGVVNEDGEGNGFHNVYTTHDVVKAYRQTGKFPDGAVLIKEVRGASDAVLTTGRAHWAAENAVWFVSIKDTTNRFPDNPLWGDGWGWALFKADAPAQQVATDYKSDCLGCHVPVKDTDWIYVHAYPVLNE